MEELPIFRASKRRKHTKTHDDSTAEITIDPSTMAESDRAIGDDGHAQNEEDADGESSKGGVIRARKPFRRPVTGVSFTNTRASERDDSNSSLVKAADEAKNRPVEITDRFISSTGQVVDVDQHMVAFVDSELAKRRIGHLPSNLPSSQPQLQSSESGPDANPSAQASGGGKASNPSSSATAIRPSLNQLSEVDLGTSTYETNLLRTKEALERARLGLPPLSTEAKPPKPRKPRIGRDGKPMKPRPPRKRRDSESLARDALVESLLHENRVGIYETSADGNDKISRLGTSQKQGQNVHADTHTDNTATAYSTNQDNGRGGGGDADADADEALAERFRQEFMDAMAERQNRHKSSNQAKHAGSGATGSGAAGAGATESKGPKLGGSRAARARMAQMQQQQQQQKLQGGASSSTTMTKR